MIEQKFTQEIKTNWLTALKSGKYKQGYYNLHNPNENTHCCIGVLGDICPFLNNDCTDEAVSGNPYKYLKDTIGQQATRELYDTNDSDASRPTPNRTYQNVIPLIEALPTQD